MLKHWRAAASQGLVDEQIGVTVPKHWRAAATSLDQLEVAEILMAAALVMLAIAAVTLDFIVETRPNRDILKTLKGEIFAVCQDFRNADSAQ